MDLNTIFFIFMYDTFKTNITFSNLCKCLKGSSYFTENLTRKLENIHPPLLDFQESAVKRESRYVARDEVTF